MAFVAYVIGWVIHFICDFIFDKLFQDKSRVKVFGSDKAFFEARANVFMYGSEFTLADINFERQLIRLARENSFNFFLISASFMLYINDNRNIIIIISSFCLLVSILSFMQWKQRFISSYKKIKKANQALMKSQQIKVN